MRTISLLHATYRAGPKAVAIRDAWLSAASTPERVEHLFACDEDDQISLATPEVSAGIVGPSTGDCVSAVRNWNNAARACSGDLLFVIADDLTPPAQWDSTLDRILVDLDPRRAPFVVNARDADDEGFYLIRHPIVSRRWYDRYGLFRPEYHGSYADNDLTYHATSLGLVIDGRALHLDHQHPTRGIDKTESHKRVIADYDYGKAVFKRRWPVWKRRMVRRPLRPRPGQTQLSAASLSWRSFVARSKRIAGMLPDAALRRLGAD